MLPRLMIVDLLLMMQVQILNSLAVRLLRAFSARFVLHYLHHFRFVETENFFLVHQNALSAHSHALTQTHGAKARSNHVVPSFMIVFALPFTSRFCSRLSFLAFFLSVFPRRKAQGISFVDSQSSLKRPLAHSCAPSMFEWKFCQSA